ncbi:hypothetical protein [Bacillus cereus]|uniref:hypothetical protein n=1 Tax=Bacillus cereus TaxID=1396 RepID=UPI000BF6A8C4|nr:hypothetical protein [Bacillus cereus]PFQ95922.1 hypothetical protein COK32_18400 [Bacillus cereus]
MDEKDSFDSRLVWKPKLSMKNVTNTLNEIGDFAQTAIDNTQGDINSILGNAEDCISTCGASVDAVRIRVQNRNIQYYTSVIEAITRNFLIPVDLVEYVYGQLKDKLKKNPYPKIFHFENPWIIWGNAKCPTNPNKDCPDPILTEINPTEIELKKDRNPYLFIHGMVYEATKKDGSDFSRSEPTDAYGFYSTFEKQAKMFINMPEEKRDKIDIYLVEYDSEMSEDEENIIRDFLIEHILIDLDPYEFLIIAAIFWKEMERRAKVTGNYILPFIEKLRDENQGSVITHSLGGYVMAHAAHKIIDTKGFNDRKSIQKWWCLSPALPSNAFTNTGEFEKAPFIAGPSRGEEIWGATTVWYSLSDIALMLLYPLANFHPAMGQTGIGIVETIGYVRDINITKTTCTTHGPGGAYMERLGPCIRWFLRTNSDDDNCRLLN